MRVPPVPDRTGSRFTAGYRQLAQHNQNPWGGINPHVRRFWLVLAKRSSSECDFMRKRGNSCISRYPLGDNENPLFPCVFAWFHGRPCQNTGPYRGASEFTAKSLPATAGSTFHAHAASSALPGARGGPCRTLLNERLKIPWNA